MASAAADDTVMDEVMEFLDENSYLLCNGLVEPLQACVALHTAHVQPTVMHCAALQYAAQCKIRTAHQCNALHYHRGYDRAENGHLIVSMTAGSVT